MLRLRAIRRGRLQTAGGPRRRAGRRAGATGAFRPLVGSVRRLGEQIAIQDPAQLSALRSKLMQAGFYSREAAVDLSRRPRRGPGVATLGVILLMPLMAAARRRHGRASRSRRCSPASRIMGPDQVLKSRRTKREREYRDGFPDLLDLLVASVEAGLSLDAAVTRVTEELARRYPNLAVHLRFLVLELRAGKSRKDAWAAFADRLGIDDARQLATMLRQAEEMGTSLGETLTVFSQDMRSKRMLRAEEKALALSAKLTVPLILFIFPCLLGSLMLPAAARLMHVFAN